MAGSLVSVRVGVEGVADTTRITRAKSFGDTAIGSDFTFWDLADESVDLGEKIHDAIIAKYEHETPVCKYRRAETRR